MDWLIWSGAAVSVAGIAGLMWCVLKVMRARRDMNIDPEAMRAVLQRAVLLNMIALMVSAVGLMMVIAGIVLGG